MDQLEIAIPAPKRRRGRPRKWDNEGERRAHEARKRIAKRAAEREPPDAEARRRLAIAARLASFAPASASLDLEVSDPDLLEIADRYPNIAEALQYSRDVGARKILACRWVQLACERHERDLSRIEDADFPYTFDARQAERVLRAMQMFRELKGARAGKRFRFQPWQRFIIASLFGWIDKNTGARRFRYSFCAVPRGNGKSSLAATLCLYMLALDHEGGAEVYAAATTRDQARIVFAAAQHMVRTDRVFRERYGVECAAHAIVQASSASVFRPLSRDAQALDGLSVQLAVLDELAQHKSREVHDVLVTACGKRRQPLVFSITTASANQAGIGFEQWKYTENVLTGQVIDEAFFGIIYTLDPGDDWQAVESWIKANPNWGISVNPEYINNIATRARSIASQQVAFKQKHLNLWTHAAIGWMSMPHWIAATDRDTDEASFASEPCVIGLDLASKVDLAACVRVYRRAIDGVNHYYVFANFYVPETQITESGIASYLTWREEGWLTGTPGEVTDFNVIEADIRALVQRHNVVDVAYDPWQALHLATNLAANDIPVIEYRPTVGNFSPPLKEIDALVRQLRLHHDGNPVMTWCVSCVEVQEDYKQNIFPRKNRADPSVRIDGLIALLMAMGRMMAIENAPGAQPTLTFI